MSGLPEERILIAQRHLDQAQAELAAALGDLKVTKASRDYYVKVLIDGGAPLDPWYVFTLPSHKMPYRGQRVRIAEGIFHGESATVLRHQSDRPAGVPYFYEVLAEG